MIGEILGAIVFTGGTLVSLSLLLFALKKWRAAQEEGDDYCK